MADRVKFCSYCDGSFSILSDHWSIEKNRKTYSIRYRCKQKAKAKSKAWYWSNKERSLQQSKIYRNSHKKELSERKSQYYQNNRDYFIKTNSQYAKNNRDKVNKRYKKWMDNNPMVKIRHRFSKSLGEFIKLGKCSSKLDFLPYTVENLVNDLTTKFKDGMSLKNYGDWHVDHVIPLKAKNPDGSYYWNQEELSDPLSKTFQDAWALSNLQPLWATDNIKKGNKING